MTSVTTKQNAAAAVATVATGITWKPMSSHLARDMCKVIFKETGLLMNAHLFRHLAGLMWLRNHPGDYESVRQMLGHKKYETTVNYYTGLNSKWALARYQNEVLTGGKVCK